MLTDDPILHGWRCLASSMLEELGYGVDVDAAHSALVLLDGFRRG